MSGSFPLNSGQSQLELHHPHVVQRLRLLWGQPEGSRYLAELMVDARGGRAGFSAAVFAELVTLNMDVPPLPIGALKMDGTRSPQRARPGYNDAHDLSRRRSAG